MSKRTAGKPEPAIAEQSVSKQARASKRVSLAICVFLILATAIVYVQVAWFPFVDLDDVSYVRGNHYVQDPGTARSIGWAFTTFRSANWHPLTWISHMIDCQLYGLAHPGGHHVTNLLLHIANALLLFALLSRMTGAVWRSGFVAVLFALHPLHVESAAWVAERKDLLSTFFWMLTVLAYVHYCARRGIGRYMLVFCAYALGLMAKPMLVSLPLVLLLLDWWPLRRFSQPKHPVLNSIQDVEGRSGLIVEKLPLFALAAGSCVVTYVAQLHSGATQSLEAFPMGVRVANALVSYVVYICKMLWPLRLAPLYPHPGNTLPIWQVIVSGTAVALVTLLAIRVRRQLPYVFVGWLWYLVMLIPVIGLVQVGPQAFADRYTYLPLVGLFIAITWGAAALARRPATMRNAVLAASAAAIIVSLGTCTWRQVRYWRGTDALLMHALAVSNGHNIVRIYIAGCWDEQGKTDRAIDLLAHAPLDQPAAARVSNALGILLLRKGKLDEAEAHFRTAIRMQPSLAGAHNNLGILLRRRGHDAAAMREFRKAASLDPWLSDPHFGLAALLDSQGRTREALRELFETIRLDPRNVEARCRAAVILDRQGKPDEELSQLRAAVDADPASPSAQYLLGCALGRAGSADEALDHLRRAVKLRPKWGPPHSSIAIALFAQEDYAGAWQEVQLAKRFGAPPSPAFIKALSSRMPEPTSNTYSP